MAENKRNTPTPGEKTATGEGSASTTHAPNVAPTAFDLERDLIHPASEIVSKLRDTLAAFGDPADTTAANAEVDRLRDLLDAADIAAISAKHGANAAIKSAFSGFCDLKVMAQAAKALFDLEDDGGMPDINRLLNIIAERADDYAGAVGEAMAVKGGAA